MYDVAAMEGDLQLVLGTNLRARRLAKNLSQEALGEAIGVHRTYIGALERGEKNPSLRSLERLAARLGVEPLSLLQMPDPNEPPRLRRGRRGGGRKGA